MAWLGQAFEQEADHSEADEGYDGSCIAFEVSHQAAVLADPGEGPLDDPSLRQDDEAVKIGALDDLDLPASCSGNCLRHFRSLVSGVGEDPLDKGKAPPRSAQQVARAVAVLNVGRQNAHAEEQTESVDEDMAFAPRDLLARIEALRRKRQAPFCAALALWGSMIAALGLASRPAASRTAT